MEIKDFGDFWSSSSSLFQLWDASELNGVSSGFTFTHCGLTGS